MEKKLDEIYLIRPIVIVLLVIYHSFIIYQGTGWPPVENIETNCLYFWIAKASYTGMLETFTFISGYLFYYSLMKHPISFVELIIKKSKRLLLPSVVFSFFYLWMFSVDFSDLFSLDSFYNLLNGSGHMWYLPMLFWCFILTYFLEKMKFPQKYKLTGLFLLMPCASIQLPFQLSTAFYYLFYFNLGCFCLRNKASFQRITTRNLLYLFVIYVFFFVGFVELTEFYKDLKPNMSNWEDVAVRLFSFYFGVVTSMFVVLLLYIISLNFIRKHTIKKEIIKFNMYCFGIYLFHQFILKYLYYHTSMPGVLGTYFLPWVGFCIALVISLGLSVLFYRTKIGRFLIG